MLYLISPLQVSTTLCYNKSAGFLSVSAKGGRPEVLADRSGT